MAARERIAESTAAVDHRIKAEASLSRLLGKAMSKRQEMLLYYLLAQCARARDLSQTGLFFETLGWIRRAEEIALATLDYGARVDLHELQGSLYRAISVYKMAVEEFSLALRLLREHAADRESFDPDFEVTLAAKTAALEYLLGLFHRALEHIQRAAELLPLATKSAIGQGTVEWTFALLDRQRNELAGALEHVEVAVDLYRQQRATNSTCRVLSLAADIALDMAELATRETSETREAYLALAARYVDEAFAVGREVNDREGIELAKLSLTRLERLQGSDGAASSAARLRAILRQARRMRDKSLLPAAQTEMGVELLARGERDAGRQWLKKAIKTAKSVNTPGLAFRAQRILRKDEGYNA